MVGPLVHLMQTAEFGVRYEAACAIANAACGGTHGQIKYVVIYYVLCFCALIQAITHSFTNKTFVC